jgi:hypothetical protein
MLGRTPWIGDQRSVYRKASTQESTTQKTRINIHASTGFRSHDSSFRAVQDRAATGVGSSACDKWTLRRAVAITKLECQWKCTFFIFKIFLCTIYEERLRPTQPPIIRVPGVKRLGREADNSPSSITEVKNAWVYTSVSPIRFHGVVLS